MRDDRCFATISDVHEYDDRLPAEARRTFDRHLKQDQVPTAPAAISRASLSHDDRSTTTCSSSSLKHRIALAPFKGWRIPLTSDEGFYINVMRMASGCGWAAT